MREARFDDLVNFSSLLWKWMLDDKNTESLHIAVNRAFELYHRDLNFARQPFGDPESFLEDDVICMLSNFDMQSFRTLVILFKRIESEFQQNEIKKRLISRILNVANPAEFPEKFERWRQLEFSQEEFDTFKSILESMSHKYPALIKILLCQEERPQDQDSIQRYISYLENAAAQTGRAVAHAGGVVKSALATAYSVAMDRVVHNSVMDFQTQGQSPRDFILQGALNVDGSWDEETSVRYLTKKWPSLNMRVIDEVCRAFYNSQVRDPAAGLEKRLAKKSQLAAARKNSGDDEEERQTHGAIASRHSAERKPISSGGLNANNANSRQDSDSDSDVYVFFPDADEIEKVETAENESQKSKQLSQFSHLSTLDPSLALFGSGRISPLKKPRHALAIYMSLLTHDVDFKQTKRMELATESSEALAIPQEKITFTDHRTTFNFFNSAAAVSSGSISVGGEHSNSLRSVADHSTNHQCEFCDIDVKPAH